MYIEIILHTLARDFVSSILVKIPYIGYTDKKEVCFFKIQTDKGAF